MHPGIGALSLGWGALATTGVFLPWLEHPGKIFFRLVQQVVATERTTYRALVDAPDGVDPLKPQ